MAGRIPQDFINDLVDRADIVLVLSSRIPMKKAGREYKACCPFHNEKTPSFTVSPDKGFYHCFGCGAHGSALGFLMEHDRLEFVDAVEELASILGVDVPRETSGSQENYTPGAPLLDLLSKADELYQEELRGAQTAIDYLKQRGLSGKVAAEFAIGYAPAGWDFLLRRLGTTDEQRDNLLKAGLVIRNEKNRTYDRFRDRIIFPIRDARGRVVGFGGRVMDHSEPKYLNAPETPVFHKGRELYGIYEARQVERNPRQLIVVEGYMDVVALACHGIHNSVATLGTATTPEHLQQLFRVSQEIVFCFDGDRAGREAAWRALQNTLPELRDGRQVKFLFLADGEDPDSVVRNGGKQAFDTQLADSQPLSEYLIEHLKAETDLSSLDGQARLAELARPLIGNIPQGVYRDLLVDRLAAEVGLSAERLGELLTGQTTERRPGRRPAAQEAQRLPTNDGRNPLIRRAICLVLQQPAAAASLQVPDRIASLPKPGIALLTDLIETAKENTGIKPARLTEEFAEHPDGGAHLATLLMQELHLDPEADWGPELQETLGTIGRQELEKRINSLTRQAANGLSEDEKQEMRDLQQQLAALHRNNN
jgi:DNA primase